MVRPGMRSLLAACLVMALAVGSAEAQKSRQKKGKKGRQRNVAANLIAQFKRLGLDDDQMKQVETIVKGYASQIAEIQKQVKLTPEQRKARSEAAAKARANGLKGRELQQAVAKEVSFTDEQKEARKKLRKLQQEIKRKVLEILTPEQKAKLREGRGKGGKRRVKKKADP